MNRCRQRIGGWVVLVVAGLALATARADETDHQQLQFADGLMARGMYTEAIREYLIFMEQNPRYDRMDVIQYRVAESYRHLRNLVAAAGFYVRVIQQEPPSPYRHRAMLRRAEMFRMSNSPQTAVRLLRDLLEERPEPEIADAARYWLGVSLEASGEREIAIRVLRDFLMSGRDTAFRPYAALELGKILVMGDDAQVTEGVTWLRGVADQPPDERSGAEAVYHLARLADRQNDRPGGATLFDEFFNRFPGDVRAVEARLPAAWTYYRVGRYADSLRICTEALADETGGARNRRDEWLYLKANNERGLEQHATAVATYGQLLHEMPRSALASAAAIEKAQSEFRLGDYERSLETMKSVRITDQNRLAAYWMLATAHDARQSDSDAIQNYRLLIEQFPDSEQAYEAAYRMGLLFQRRGDRRQAAEYFQRVASQYPDRPMAPVALMASAEMLRALDRHSEAVRDYGLLLQRFPDHELAERALFQKAVTEAHLDRVEMAMASFQEFGKRFPKSGRFAEAAFMLGLLYTRQDKYQAAETEFSRALKAKPDEGLRTRIQFRRAVALQQLGRDSDAAAGFRQLLNDPRMDRFDPALLEWLSEQMRRERRFPDAIKAADLLVQRAGDQAAWIQSGHALAGLAAAAAGNDDVARQRLEAALAVPVVTPYAAEAAVHLGDILLRDNQVTDARRRYRQAEETAQDDGLLALRARAQMGVGACFEAENDLTEAGRQYMLVGLTYDIPELSPKALRAAASVFERLERTEARDHMLRELEQRYGASAPKP